MDYRVTVLFMSRLLGELEREMSSSLPAVPSVEASVFSPLCSHTPLLCVPLFQGFEDPKDK